MHWMEGVSKYSRFAMDYHISTRRGKEGKGGKGRKGRKGGKGEKWRKNLPGDEKKACWVGAKNVYKKLS